MILLSIVLIGCQTESEPLDSGDEISDTHGPTWYSEVKPIIEHNCQGCHKTGDLSGISLATYEDVVAWALPVRTSVENRTMPPWLAEPDCNSYQNDFSLSDEEVNTILSWVDAGTPEGDPSTAAEEVAPWQPPALDRVDLSLALPTEYTPTSFPDDYRCFLVEWPYEESVWVTGYDIQPGNDVIVHHVIPYIINPSDVPSYQALNDEDDEPGYSCYGGPGGGLTTLLNTRWLGSWAPGGGAAIYPDGVGVEIAPGSMIAIQMHYYGSGGDGSDQTQINIKVETEEQDWANIQPWTDVAWVAGAGMDIPANTDDVSHSFSYTLSNSNFVIQNASLHMHTLGRSGSLKIRHADGSETCLLEIDKYDFNWQRGYTFEEPVVVSSGDTVELNCTWDNPTDNDVSWGDGTDDEMCLGVTFINGN